MTVTVDRAPRELPRKARLSVVSITLEADGRRESLILTALAAQLGGADPAEELRALLQKAGVRVPVDPPGL